jgi:hypothetical protein
MKKILPLFLVALLLCEMTLNAVAAPSRVKKSIIKQTGRKVASTQVVSKKNFYLFGGVDLGYAMYSKSTASTLPDGTRSGIDIGVHALASYYLGSFVFDGGLGFAFLSSSGTDTTGAPLTVKTGTIYLDFSPRFRLDQNWQIGPELQFWLGGDKGLDPDLLSASNNAFMGGAVVAYEWTTAGNKFRVGARWNTDFNVLDRNLNVIQAFFQIGFGLGEGSRSYPQFNEELKRSDLENVQSAPVEQVAPEPIENNEVEPEPELMSTPAPVEQ